MFIQKPKVINIAFHSGFMDSLSLFCNVNFFICLNREMKSRGAGGALPHTVSFSRYLPTGLYQAKLELCLGLSHGAVQAFEQSFTT